MEEKVASSEGDILECKASSYNPIGLLDIMLGSPVEETAEAGELLE